MDVASLSSCIDYRADHGCGITFARATACAVAASKATPAGDILASCAATLNNSGVLYRYAVGACHLGYYT